MAHYFRGRIALAHSRGLWEISEMAIINQGLIEKLPSPKRSSQHEYLPSPKLTTTSTKMDADPS
jgi:hypothetical protein